MIRVLRNLLPGAPLVPERGEDNARRFVQVVEKLARERRLIECYPHNGYHGHKTERHGWYWMSNPEWRARVLQLLADASVRGATFCAPDDFDGWSFHCYSIVHTPRVALLTLEESA